ncbi:uncharacterized protein LY89DRAFT_692066 [Mollisia scopiformis]|uniref:Uncharacterized protein n=1 Tax=Mollisia scopiformis TaxID=149040 RepID=A0A132B3M1_MOLSC|nr:uncharacterized protein LY89DRAFT_692066 [Mollisia scopiformis]KUJ06986.1 hypothetical protein LY89DRAFT_692066 [Mollisia scopiformis]
MTSRKKIIAITKAAKRLSCSVVIKTGAPPGIMLAEGKELDAGDWLEVVRKLRYKDYRLVKREEIPGRRLDVEPGNLVETTSLKELRDFLSRDEDLYKWWGLQMKHS